MKVNELIKHLQRLDQNTEIMVSIRKDYRPIGVMKHIHTEEITPVVDQDTGEIRYSIGIDINAPMSS